MAKDIDKLLGKYFSGGIDYAIKLRKLELSVHETDENIGGSYRTNKVNRTHETSVINVMNDDKLIRLQRAKQIVELATSVFNDEDKQILVLRYKYKKSWLSIGMEMCIGDQTCMRRMKAMRETMTMQLNIPYLCQLLYVMA